MPQPQLFSRIAEGDPLVNQKKMKPAEQIAFSFEPARKTFSVAELNAAIHSLLGREFSDVWVTGEISGTRLATSGHYYLHAQGAGRPSFAASVSAPPPATSIQAQDGVAVIAPRPYRCL